MPHAIHMCAGMLESPSQAIFLPISKTVGENRSFADQRVGPWESSSWNTAAATFGCSHEDQQQLSPLFFLLLGSGVMPASSFISQTLQQAPNGSFCAVGTCEGLFGQGLFVGPDTTIGCDVAGLVLPAAEEGFIADVIQAVYGSARWGGESEAADAVFAGFHCDKKLSSLLFAPGLPQNIGATGLPAMTTGVNAGDEEQARMVQEFQELQAEMEKFMVDNDIEDGEYEEQEEWEWDEDDMEEEEWEWDEDEEDEEEDDIMTQIAATGGSASNNVRMRIIDGSCPLLAVGQKITVEADTPPLMLAVKDAMVNGFPLALIPEGSSDGSGTRVEVVDLRDVRPGGESTVVLEGVEQVRVHRIWYEDGAFGSQLGEAAAKSEL